MPGLPHSAIKTWTVWKLVQLSNSFHLWDASASPSQAHYFGQKPPPPPLPSPIPTFTYVHVINVPRPSLSIFAYYRLTTDGGKPRDKAKQDPLIHTEVAYDSLLPRLRNSLVNQVKFLGLTHTYQHTNFLSNPPKKGTILDVFPLGLIPFVAVQSRRTADQK